MHVVSESGVGHGQLAYVYSIGVLFQHRLVYTAVALFGRGASLYHHRLQLFESLWVRLPLPTGQFSEI